MRPYLDSQVTVDINDARAHIAQDTRQYDIVSFGHLDSIMLLSSFSSIRLDSYVYTEESIRRAFSLVKPGGLLSMSFASQRFVTDKIYDLLGRATGLTPLRVIDSYMGRSPSWCLRVGPIQQRSCSAGRKCAVPA